MSLVRCGRRRGRYPSAPGANLDAFVANNGVASVIDLEINVDEVAI
ncbi:MAG: hypothetical protein ACFCBW_02840 [Candidatus Competibacterales bacterium]